VLQQVLLKKKESDRAQSARVQSYAHLLAQEENEPFRKLITYNTEESEHMFERMFYQEKDAGEGEGEGEGEAEASMGNGSAMAATGV
jgi:hypothetical protein